MIAAFFSKTVHSVTGAVRTFCDDWSALGLRYAVRAASDRFVARWSTARHGIRRRVMRQTVNSPSSIASPGLKRGILFVGYVEAALGLGESLRGLIAAYATTGEPFAILPFNRGVETRHLGQFMPEAYDFSNRYDLVVIEVAVDQLPIVFETIDPRLFAGARIALRTYWELPQAPKEWASILAKADEIWAPNAFVANAFRDIFEGRIVVVPPCVEPETINLPSLERFGFDKGRFNFLFTFDFFSFPARKNPLGVIEAFRRAFPIGSENVGLVIKSTGNPARYPEVARAFRTAIRRDKRIAVIDGDMSRKDIHGLIAGCDAYVSLHRAEGFGFGMAEAMFFEKPVIGTAYSGNTEFLNDETGFPVAYALRAVNPDEYVWSTGQTWAEPNLNSAVAMLQAVFSDPDNAKRVAAAGSAFIRTHHSYSAVGAVVSMQLERIISARQANVD
ncbi:glycosyl transferases group 1 [Variibacter gotjawalensis]|uniref:Glycosyl transferases group 1 n=2 Tax=Variibacter gotjawalensis TaxID=1333996 RepID=A0A0S3PNU2_9BRAD|nr:glycosyltransferase involved in cell wall biosynthesis [Variibacter gotjawalensis]BAT57594.1 glycosyl transferases group 1 [Variibacter gotjawalensis]